MGYVAKVDIIKKKEKKQKTKQTCNSYIPGVLKKVKQFEFHVPSNNKKSSRSHVREKLIASKNFI